MSKFYITTSIAYVNAAPHLGFALELVQADAIARFRRAQGDTVFFLTGTDEHGAKIARAAEAAGKEPRVFVDEHAAQFQALKKILNISWDDFIRTSDEKRHFPQVVSLWNKLAAAGDIYKKKYRGLYCVGHEAFVTDKDLEEGKCRDHGAAPEIIEEENYFFRLSKYAFAVKKLIESGAIRIVPEGREKEIVNFINQGMEDVSFSRPRADMPWGVPVPHDETQTVYVWADALANYLYPANQWPADLQCIGKDILRFHALYWPAMLLSAEMPLPRNLFVHGHITVEGKKMSKTLGNVVDPVALVAKYGADAARYYLLREIPPTDDGDFSYEKFHERYTADLVNGLGNFAARVLSLGQVQGAITVGKDGAADEIEKMVGDAERTVARAMGAYRFNEALAAIGHLIAFGDRYINAEEPWKKENKTIGRAAIAVANAVRILKAIARLIEPFLPETAEKIARCIIADGDAVRVQKGVMLFPRRDA